MSTASLVWGMLFGAIGGGYAIYGHRQKQIVALVCGLIPEASWVTGLWIREFTGGLAGAVRKAAHILMLSLTTLAIA